jgi:hypothetical protein
VAPSDRKSARAIGEREKGLVAAFQEVTESVVTLARNHVELAKAEARHDAKLYGQHAGKVAFGVAFALLGFGIFNAGIILTAGWLGGMMAMAITALVLATAYMVVGIGIAKTAMQQMQESEAMRQTKTQIQRSSEWVKEIREESSQRRPEPNSSPETAMTKSPD